ncbi:Predicted alpha/beta hydrolase BEM46 [Phaffia rhodozyma]|uniref:Predicted alpha/beta hydrolase BEM46 n=1 Tax=Phaffia rhodozyma TaxID=264483 RepID=A0A0F7SM30_PHARH|nr:Predicted alpha/beta hydrolase BEM46 [Phaffia rhodozyma]
MYCTLARLFRIVSHPSPYPRKKLLARPSHTRTIVTASSVPWYLVASVLIGLPATLWSYKCLMMILFQRKILYMGFLPPGSRTTKIDKTNWLLRGLDMKELEFPSIGPDGKGVILRGLELSQERPASSNRLTTKKSDSHPDRVLIYLQGNMGSPVSRLPLFRQLLLSDRSPFSSGHTKLLIVPPRSFYLSTNTRPTQPGLLNDYRTVLEYAWANYPQSRIVLYGHSLGGTAICCMLSELKHDEESNSVEGVVLENAFPSVKRMITQSLYPSRYLPYHYLTPFVFDPWDALSALETSHPHSLLYNTPILFLSGSKDSLVLPSMGKEMFEAARLRNGTILRRWVLVEGKGHDDVWQKSTFWGMEVGSFLKEIQR